MTPAVDLLVKDAGLLVVDGEREIPGGWVALSDGRVTSVGTAGSEPTARRVVPAAGRLVTPGLVNTHHHMYQNLTRSYAPAVQGSLFDWLTTLYPLWADLDEEAAYVSAYVGMAELLMGGCTTSTDHLYVHPRPGLVDAEIRAARDIGFRFHATRGSMTRSVEDGGLPPRSVTQTTDQVLADSERLVRAHHDPRPGALVRVALAPCSPFSVTKEVMTASAELAERYDVRLHTHLAEDRDEDTYCRETYGCRPVEYFEDCGWLTDRAWVAHCIHPNDDELRRLAAAGVGVAHCPSSNMLIGGGTARVTEMRGLGMPVGLGCDGSASTDHASLWLETRGALLLARYRGGPGAMSARDALDIATRGSAGCLGRADELGHLRPGACADLVVWDLHEVALAGALSDPVETWLRCGPARAWTTVVAGRVLVDRSEPNLPALSDALRAHARIARRWQERA
ncbi:8-oxoguanine deaminase [Streptomyces olivochromogenes]|uniref:8-oxoguanine deaminase n=1 Tax=Streptomyces olivochromogenes TaxID=1963 RepID=UPI001F22C381|nr:8-oxoguanine deaminase [Streptomyces olivochromogenes]MCF3129298.1 8-oxoguanine deaminase [Streptomyces olivochromogenes]